MTSLVERLRDEDFRGPSQHLRDYAEIDGLMVEAANRIEQLERENAELRAMLANRRREALEEAAKIADDYECHLASYGGSVDAQHFYEGGMLDAGQGIALAIRALSDSTPTPLQEQNDNMGKEGE